MRLLHLIRRRPDSWVKEMIEKQSQHHEITIVLIQEAVHLEEQLPSRVIALTEDLWRKGLDGKIPEISYGELLTLIFNHDRVFCW